MQLSAPHGSIVILGGSRLFWNVCEAQWVTESTFTLTHVCNIINLAAAGVGAALAHIWAQRRTHRCEQTDTQTYAHWQVHTQHAQGLTSKASCWAGLSSLLHWAELTGLQAGGGDPVCLNTVPCQGLCFWGWQLSAAGQAGALCMLTPSRWLSSPARNL